MKHSHRIFSFSMNVSIISALIVWLACNNPTQPTASGTPSVAATNADSNAAAASVQDSNHYAPSVDVPPAKMPKAQIDSNSRVIYFTMDDGPLQPSSVLVDIAEEKKVKISEFAVGKHALASKSYMGHLDRMKRSPWMEVHNHSYSHAYGKYKLFYSNPQKAADDIMGNEEKIASFTKIVRMPGRDIWATPNIKRGWNQSGAKTAEILLQNGFRVYGWDVEWDHHGNTLPKKTPEQFVALVDNLFARQAMQTRNHLVILGHDEMLIKEKGRQDLRQIIDMLKSRGYIFEFITHYPK